MSRNPDRVEYWDDARRKKIKKKFIQATQENLKGDVIMDNIVIDSVAFEGDTKGYHLKGSYLSEPKGEALIDISKEGKMVKEFLFPAYKIWNIPAHAEDIVAGLEQDSDIGLRIAGSDGLGGNVYRSAEVKT
jgi:hypothetical protein